MKINKLIQLSILAASIFIGATSCEKDKLMTPNDLPNEIKNYINSHFPNNAILQVIKEKDGISKNYDIILANNINLEFNGKKEITDIDGSEKLPNSVIPTKILDYVTTNYPDDIITDWSLDDKNQSIKLNNRLELEFNKKGDFLRIDN